MAKGRLGAMARSLALIVSMAGCAGSLKPEPRAEKDNVSTPVPAQVLSLKTLPAFPVGFPGTASLSGLSRRGSGPVEWLWDETDAWLLEDGRAVTYARRALRLWKGAKEADLPGLLVAGRSSLVGAQVAAYGPGGDALGLPRDWAPSRQAGGDSRLDPGLPADFAPGMILLTEALVESPGGPGEPSFFAMPGAEPPSHRFVVQVRSPKSHPLHLVPIGLEASSRDESGPGWSSTGILVKDPSWTPPEAGAPPDEESAMGAGVTPLASWEEAASILGASLNENAGPTPELRALAVAKPGDAGGLGTLLEKLSSKLRRATASGRPLLGLGRAADILASGKADPNQANLVLGAALLAGGWDTTFIVGRSYGDGPLMAALPSVMAPNRLVVEVQSQNGPLILDAQGGAPPQASPPSDMEGRLALRIRGAKGLLVSLAAASGESAKTTRTLDLFPGTSGRYELVIREKPGLGGPVKAFEPGSLLERLAPGWTLTRWEETPSGDRVLSATGRPSLSGKTLSLAMSEFPAPELPRQGLENRTRPLELGPRTSFETVIRIHVPEGATVLRNPPETRLTFRQGSYESGAEAAFKLVTWRRTVSFEESRIPAEEVPAYGAFLRQVQSAEGEKLQIKLP